jgi:hypothetical protein
MMPRPNSRQSRAPVTDLTEQKIAEEKIRLAVESCPSGMVRVDAAARMSSESNEVA